MHLVNTRRVLQAPQSVAKRVLMRGAGAVAASSVLSACSSKPPKPASPQPTGSSLGRVAWQAAAGSMQGGKNVAPVNFAPVFVAGAIWFSASDGAITRVDPLNGKVTLRVNAGKPLVAGVGCDGDTAVVAAKDGTIIAFDTEGKVRWTAQHTAEAVSVPAVGVGVAVIRFSDNRLFGFDSETGKRRWQVQRQAPALVLRQTNSVAIDSTSVYAGLPGGRLLAISVKTGAVRWETSVSQPKGANEIERIADVVGTPLVSGRELCAATYQGKLSCFEVSSGRPLWARDIAARSGLDIDNRLVCVVDEVGHVHAFSRSGTVLWKQTRLGQRSLTAPLSVDGYLVVGDEDGLIYVLSRDTGDIVGRISTDGSAILSAPCVADKLAIFQTSRGGIFAISLG
jgi:outer membrane protein assembly factor BamB